MKPLQSILLISFFHLSLITYSQDWNLMNPEYQYNYSINEDSEVVSTLWVDSTMQVNEGNSIYYLNRIVTNCDTCDKWEYNSIPKYAFYNQSQFLQGSILLTDSSYTFKTPNNFIIYPKTNVGFSWVFDTLNNITATNLSIEKSQTFNQEDSIKTILLSTGDTILISKNYGVLRFDPIYDTNTFNLVGINNSFGDFVPDFSDFFDFDIGDIFEYHGSLYYLGGANDYIKKVFIESKNIVSDTIIYGVHTDYYSMVVEDDFNPLLTPNMKRYNAEIYLLILLNIPQIDLIKNSFRFQAFSYQTF